jgi:hypothetical protein
VTPSPTPPVPTPLFEVYANEECSERPIVGNSYQSLFVRFNAAIPADFTAVYGQGLSQFEQAEIMGKVPGEQFQAISVYIDFFAEIEQLVSVNTVIQVQEREAVELESPLVVSFGTI